MTHSVVGPLSVCHLHNPIIRRFDAVHGWLPGLVPFSTRAMLRNVRSCTDCPTYIQGTYPSSPRALTMPLRIMPEDLHPRTSSCSPSIIHLARHPHVSPGSPLAFTCAWHKCPRCALSALSLHDGSWTIRRPQFIPEKGAFTTPTAHQETTHGHAVPPVAQGLRREPSSTIAWESFEVNGDSNPH